MKYGLSIFSALLLVGSFLAAVPVSEAAPKAKPVEVEDAADQVVININTASVEELILIPGIGPTLAERILSFRGEEGAFTSLEDIMLVNGIGEVKFERIKAHLAL